MILIERSKQQRTVKTRSPTLFSIIKMRRRGRPRRSGPKVPSTARQGGGAGSYEKRTQVRLQIAQEYLQVSQDPVSLRSTRQK